MRNSKIRILGNERNLFSVEREASNAPLFRQIDLTKAVATLATGMPFLRHLTIIKLEALGISTVPRETQPF